MAVFWRIFYRALLCFCMSEKNADRKSADKKNTDTKNADKKSVPGKASAFPGTLYIGGYAYLLWKAATCSQMPPPGPCRYDHTD